MSIRKAKLNKGQSLVEVLVAIGIFMAVVGAITTTLYSGQSVAIDAENAGNAAESAIEGREAVRSIRNRDWNSLTDGFHGLQFVSGQWEFSGANDSEDIFTRIVSIGSPDSNTRIATTTITWSTEAGRIQKTEVVEKLSRWDNPAQGVCKIGPLTGNWANPQSLGSADLGAGVSGTDVVVKLPYVYISGVSSTAAKHDIFVWDVTNPALPQLTASLDIGSKGINAIFVRGNYLYAASPNDGKELMIFDISTPGGISEAGSLDLTGSTDAFSVIAFGVSSVAIGRDEAATNELVFINVANPASPQIISQVAIGDDVNDFTVTNERLYLVSEDSVPDIWVYDITDPLNPALVNNHQLGSNDYISIYLQDKDGATLLVGSEDESGNEFMSIGATNTAQMYVRDKVSPGGEVNDIICVEGDLAFLATTNSTKEFLIYKVLNPDDIVEYASLNFPQAGSGIDFADNKVFMSVRSNDALRIITAGP